MTDATEASSLVSPSDDELDPELLALPDPPKRERTVTVVLLVFTALASLAMVFALRRDAAYAFGSGSPVELGELGKVPAASLVANRHVHASVMLGAARAIRYERPLVPDSFRLMPVAGREDVWVEVRVPPRGENIRYVPPSQVTGRLIRFADAGPRHRGLASAVREATGSAVPADAWLLVDGAGPTDARWAVILVGLFACFAAWNAFAMRRLLRKVS